MLMPAGRSVASATSRARMRRRTRAPSGSARRGTTRLCVPPIETRVSWKVWSCSTTIASITTPASKRPVIGRRSRRFMISAIGPAAAILPSDIKTMVRASWATSSIAWLT